MVQMRAYGELYSSGETVCVGRQVGRWCVSACLL